MADLGLRAQRVGPPAAHGPEPGRWPTSMLDAGNPFFTDVARGIEMAAEAADGRVALQQRRPAEREAPPGPAAAAAGPGHPDHAGRPRGPAARRDRPAGHPGRHRRPRPGRVESFCSVAVDDVLGGRLAVERLSTAGHRGSRSSAGPRSLGQVRERRAGCRAAWAEAGLPAEDLRRGARAPLERRQGRAAGERIAGLPGASRPTAAFCANDLIALGLLQQTIAAGVRVPGDVAIVGYDDIEFAAAAAVPLTSVRQPRQQLGRPPPSCSSTRRGNPEHAARAVFVHPRARRPQFHPGARRESCDPADPGARCRDRRDRGHG